MIECEECLQILTETKEPRKQFHTQVKRVLEDEMEEAEYSRMSPMLQCIDDINVN